MQEHNSKFEPIVKNEEKTYGFLRAFWSPSRFKGRGNNWLGYDGSHISHYTNLDGLLGIIKSGGFWLSDFRFLNDTEEYFNGCRLAQKILAELSTRSRYAKFSPILKKTAEYLNDSPRKSFFICSFSQSSDSLEQWRAYAGGRDGVVIVFENKPPLQLSHFTVMPMLHPQKVIYDDSIKCKLLLRTIAKFALEFAKGLPIDCQVDHDDWSRHLASALSVEFMLFKNHAFTAEKEIRLVASEHYLNHFKGVKHRVSGGKIIPYLESSDLYDEKFFKLLGSESLPISEIKIGPIANQSTTIESVKVFLQNSGYPEVPVTASSIPYRG